MLLFLVLLAVAFACSGPRRTGGVVVMPDMYVPDDWDAPNAALPASLVDTEV